LDELEEQGYLINFATLVGHSWALRESVGISDPYAAATPGQRAEMIKLANQGLDEGAFGISFGLEYAPGADDAEILPLAELAAKYDKLVPIHIRTDALDFAKGLHEAILIMEKRKRRQCYMSLRKSTHQRAGFMALTGITFFGTIKPCRQNILWTVIFQTDRFS
jgi:N-acyl-D-aspartate/D-glutamate deacylase